MCCCGRGSHESNMRSGGLHGPTDTRSCTDKFSLLLLLSYTLGMIVVTAYVADLGDPYILLNGVDSFGNVCGKNNDVDRYDGNLYGANTKLDMTDFSNLYYVDPTDSNAAAVCVRTCPTTTGTTSLSTGVCLTDQTGYGPYRVPAAVFTSSNNSYYNTEATANGCPPNTYSTYELANRCIPNPADATSITTTFTSGSGIFASYTAIAEGLEYTREITNDFYTARYEIAYCMLIALGASMLMIILMRFTVKVVVYVVIFSTLLAACGATAMLWIEYKTRVDQINNARDSADTNGQSVEVVSEEQETTRDYFLAGSIIASVITFLLLIVIVAMRKRIRMAIAVFEEASKSIGATPSIFISPFLTFSILAGFLVYWVYVTMYLMTLQEYYTDETTGFVAFQWETDSGQTYPDEDTWNFLFAYWLVGMLWITQFILAAATFTVAGAVVAWYFSGPHDGYKKVEGHHKGFFGSIGRLIRYHLGTIALGSLIIAIIQAVRAILTYIQHKTKGKTGKVAKFVLTCCHCCLWCLEKCMKYINKNAYIECSIHGYSFCSSAYTAFSTLVHNILLVSAVNGIGFLMLTLTKVMVSAGSALAAYAQLYDDDTVKDSLWIVLLFVTFMAWIIADAFLDLYATAIDAVLLCFLEDKKWNDGSCEEKRYHCGRSLQKFLLSQSKHLGHSMKHPTTGDEESVYGKKLNSNTHTVSEV